MLIKLIIIVVGSILLVLFQHLVCVEITGSIFGRIAYGVAQMLLGVAIWNAG